MHPLIFPIMMLAAGQSAVQPADVPPPESFSGDQSGEWTPLSEPDPDGILSPLPPSVVAARRPQAPKLPERRRSALEAEAEFQAALRRAEESIKRTKEAVARAQAAADAAPQ